MIVSPKLQTSSAIIVKVLPKKNLHQPVFGTKSDFTLSSQVIEDTNRRFWGCLFAAEMGWQLGGAKQYKVDPYQF